MKKSAGPAADDEEEAQEVANAVMHKEGEELDDAAGDVDDEDDVEEAEDEKDVDESDEGAEDADGKHFIIPSKKSVTTPSSSNDH